jgi:hypothetical protein
VEPLDISTNEGWPVAMDIWFAFRPMEVGSALTLHAAAVSRVMRSWIRISCRGWNS